MEETVSRAPLLRRQGNTGRRRAEGPKKTFQVRRQLRARAQAGGDPLTGWRPGAGWPSPAGRSAGPSGLPLDGRTAAGDGQEEGRPTQPSVSGGPGGASPASYAEPPRTLPRFDSVPTYVKVRVWGLGPRPDIAEDGRG